MKVKNTFIEIDIQSPMIGTGLSVARQARSLPTTPWTRLSTSSTDESDHSLLIIAERERMDGENQTVFQWSPAAIDSDSNSALRVIVKNTFLSLNTPTSNDESEEGAFRSR